MTRNLGDDMNMANLKTWTNNQAEEDLMNDGHAHHWEAMLSLLPDKTITPETSVLDFGCNQGGFLRRTYAKYPFKRALGIDIAEDSLTVAEQKKGHIPVEYTTVEKFLEVQPLHIFDVAFSHEVIYLLRDLNEHARIMNRVLKPGATYYAATGCHTDNPLWHDWHGKISAYSNIPVPQYALHDYVSAFKNNNFNVAFRPFGIQDYIKSEPDDAVYFPSPAAKMNYYAQHKILFRFTKNS